MNFHCWYLISKSTCSPVKRIQVFCSSSINTSQQFSRIFYYQIITQQLCTVDTQYAYEIWILLSGMYYILQMIGSNKTCRYQISNISFYLLIVRTTSFHVGAINNHNNHLSNGRWCICIVIMKIMTKYEQRIISPEYSFIL